MNILTMPLERMLQMSLAWHPTGRLTPLWIRESGAQANAVFHVDNMAVFRQPIDQRSRQMLVFQK
jgi:hypothetical protein